MVKSTECLEETVIQELAAGTATVEVVEQNCEHIAQCDRCGRLLKRYIYEFSDDLTQEEEVIMSQLESSKPERQKAIARMLRRSRSWKTVFGGFLRWLKRP